MPVGATDSLVSVHASRAAGESVMIEDSFVEFDGLVSVGFAGPGDHRIGLEGIEHGGDVALVPEGSRESHHTGTVHLDEPGVAGPGEAGKKGIGLEILGVQDALFADRRNVTHRIEQEGVLVGPMQ